LIASADASSVTRREPEIIRNEVVAPLPTYPVVVGVPVVVGMLAVFWTSGDAAFVAGIFAAGLVICLIAAKRHSQKYFADAFRQAREEGRPRPYVRYTRPWN
jgi:hypothetical protein